MILITGSYHTSLPRNQIPCHTSFPSSAALDPKAVSVKCRKCCLRERNFIVAVIIIIIHIIIIILFFSPFSFQEMVSYFGLRPKSGEKDVAPGFVFMLWYEFCCDFKNTWKRESKTISKER